MSRVQRLGFVALLAVLPACEESPVIGEREKVRDRVVDIRREIINGQARLDFRVTVPGEAIHPHIEGNWTVGNVERPVDTFLFRAADYNPAQPPAGQAYAWTSTRAEGSGIGTSRTQQLRFHPTAGDWVVVFFNPAVNPVVGRTELSAEIEVTYFR